MRDLLSDAVKRTRAVAPANTVMTVWMNNPAWMNEIEHDETLIKLGCQHMRNLLIVPRTNLRAFRKRLSELTLGLEWYPRKSSVTR